MANLKYTIFIFISIFLSACEWSYEQETNTVTNEIAIDAFDIWMDLTIDSQ